jgi:DNA end-binding protein Ku
MIAAMTARAIGTATVSFGLVSIPVKIYSSNEPGEQISFNLLHAKCKSRLKQQYICPRDNEIVPRNDMVKGYEYAKDQYVVFTEEELKAVEAVSTKSIEIIEFVPADKVPPVHFDKAYYLGTDKGGEKAYKLLGEAMKQSGRAGLARYAAHGNMNLVLVRPWDDGLMMQQLRYADEVKPFSEVPLGDAPPITPAELKLAMQIVDHISTDDFHGDRYKDEVKEAIQGLIQQKVAGRARGAGRRAQAGQARGRGRRGQGRRGAGRQAGPLAPQVARHCRAMTR